MILLRVLFISIFFAQCAPVWAQGGALDTSFGVAGLASAAFTASSQANGVAVQADGKIVIAGKLRTSLHGSDCALARYLPSGAPDPSFGANGLVSLDIGNGDDVANAVLVQPDGKIVIAGQAITNNGQFVLLARYAANGTLDPGFGSAGLVATSVLPVYNTGTGVARQADGKLVVSAYCGRSAEFTVLRYTTTGTLDAGFGTAGVVRVPINSVSEAAMAVVIQADQKIVATGFTQVSGGQDVALVRLLPSGVLDASFDGDGKLTTSIGGEDRAYAVLQQADGKLVVAGFTTLGGSNRFALIRFLSNGALDVSFGVNSHATTAFGVDEAVAYSIVQQPDGKLVAAGSGGSSNSYFALARYLPTGALDPSFGNAGRVTTFFPANSAHTGRGLARQTDGKLVLAGTIVANGTEYASAVRYTSGVPTGLAPERLASTPAALFPNPATADAQSLLLTYFLPQAGAVQIRLFDPVGRLIREVRAARWQPAGSSIETISISGLPAQVCWLSLETARSRQLLPLVIR